MNFFTVNDELCANCNSCERVCPVNAIEHSGKCSVIDYSKCIACGVCFKVCPHGAIEIDIPADEINQLFSEREKYHDNELVVNSLAEENRVLKENLFKTTDRFKNIINILPYGILVIDHDKKISYSNNVFVSLLDHKSRLIAEELPSLVGVDVSSVLPEDISSLLISSLYSGENTLNQNVELGKNKLVFSAYSIKKSHFVVAIFRDLYNDQIIKEEITSRIQEVIDKNMAMIQNIGFLMGEETSKTTKTLNSIITSLKATK